MLDRRGSEEESSCCVRSETSRLHRDRRRYRVVEVSASIDGARALPEMSWKATEPQRGRNNVNNPHDYLLKEMTIYVGTKSYHTRNVYQRELHTHQNESSRNLPPKKK